MWIIIFAIIYSSYLFVKEMSQAQQAELHSTLREKYKDIVSLNHKGSLRQPLFNTHKRSYSTSKNASF